MVAATPTIDQWLELRRPERPQISPDGRYVVYAVQEANWAANQYVHQLWVGVVASGAVYQLTTASGSSHSPSWAPDSTHLAFISDRDGSNEIFLIAVTGGEARALTHGGTQVQACRWSPDGRHIAYTAVAPASPTRQAREAAYGAFEVVDADYELTTLWVIAVPAADDPHPPQPARVLAEAAGTVGQFAWAPDGRRIAFAAAPDPLIRSAAAWHIAVLDLAAHTVVSVVRTPGPHDNPIWSPDGTAIAFETANGRAGYYYTNRCVAVVPATGGPARLLTESFDSHAELIAWAAQGIYVRSLQRTYAHLFRVDPTSAGIERVSQPANCVYWHFSFTADGTQLACIGADHQHYPEVYVTAVTPFTPRRLSTFGNQVAAWRLATREVITWQAPDGTPIEGVLWKPATVDLTQRYPLLVAVHSGPITADQAIIDRELPYPLELLAAKGAFVLRPNYRGSDGYGEAFRALKVGSLGVGDYGDIIAGIDYVIAQGNIDGARVGALGWSHGGYIVAFLATYGTRFRAVSAGAVVADWTTFYTNSDGGAWALQYLKATPWEQPEVYRASAPLTYAPRATTPVLLQHGELDRRAPVAGAYALYRALQDHAVPVKLVIYHGAGHTSFTLKQLRAIMQQNLEWFGHWIWGEGLRP